jgi:hypothetical protein
VDTFLILLSLGAAAIAVWTHARFERLGPRDFRGALLHCGMALGVGWFVVPLAMKATLAAGASPLLVLFGIALPSLVYLFLAALWVIKHAQALLLRR